MSHLRQGDTFEVWKLDRLSRSVKRLVYLVGELAHRGLHFRSVTDSIGTFPPAGRFFFHVMASMAQMERELIVERTQAGLAAAHRRRVAGRKRRMTETEVAAARRLLANGKPARDVAQNLGVSIPNLCRWLSATEREDGD